MSAPLHGITVVSLEQAVAAPFATRQLADLGARVIKVERPGVGDFARGYDETVKGLSSHFVWINRAKQSLTLNLKHPEALSALKRLLDGADVFVQNLAPGATTRLGLDAASLRSGNPRLIVCDISGFGASGPYRDKKAYDLLIQCEAGLVSVTGTPETPAKAGISVADIAGAMYAYSGILTALYRREREGEGAHLEVSLFDGLAEWMGFPAYFAAYGGRLPPRNGASHSAIAPYGPFACGDGGQVNLGIQNEREWRMFCERVLARPALADDERFSSNSRRVENREALREAIEAVFAGFEVAQAVARLDEAGIANARMNDMHAFWEHPQLAARGRWSQVDTPAGPIRALQPPVIMDGVAGRMEPIPALGEHTGGILGELGYGEADIRRLREAGAI